jgi:hypothetical protein
MNVDELDKRSYGVKAIDQILHALADKGLSIAGI